MASAAESSIWNLFCDWCAAVGETAIPADPETLARFIADNPAAGATQRRRVGAINAVHRRRGYPPPGRTQAVRELLDTRRRLRRERTALAAAAAITLLPDTGWPTALFARRDAMILALAGSGLSAAAIAALRMGDIDATETGLLRIASGGETLTTGAELVAAGVSPADIWQAWEAVRRVQHRLPSTRRVIQLLEGKPLPAVGPAPDDAPLLVALDRWGAAEINPGPLGADAISRIAAGHLSGRPAVHKPIQPTAAPTDPDTGDEPSTPPEPVVLDPNVAARGLEARRRASALLDGVGEELDAVEARADALLAGLLELLDEPGR